VTLAGAGRGPPRTRISRGGCRGPGKPRDGSPLRDTIWCCTSSILCEATNSSDCPKDEGRDGEPTAAAIYPGDLESAKVRRDGRHREGTWGDHRRGVTGLCVVSISSWLEGPWLVGSGLLWKERGPCGNACPCFAMCRADHAHPTLQEQLVASDRPYSTSSSPKMTWPPSGGLRKPASAWSPRHLGAPRPARSGLARRLDGGARRDVCRFNSRPTGCHQPSGRSPTQ
jgi:hypothetical protein